MEWTEILYIYEKQHKTTRTA